MSNENNDIFNSQNDNAQNIETLMDIETEVAQTIESVSDDVQDEVDDFNIDSEKTDRVFSSLNQASEQVDMPEFVAKEPSVPKKKGGIVKKVCAIALSAVLFGAIAGGTLYGTNLLLEKNKKPTVSNEKNNSSDNKNKQHVNKLTNNDDKKKPTTEAQTTETGDSLSVEAIAKNCMPSVVAITNLGVSDVVTFWGTYQQESQSAGSGVVIGQTEDELVILTNYHVVEGSNQLTVVFSFTEDEENPEAVNANVKGYDANKDLAVIAIKLTDLTDELLSEIKIAVVGDSDELVLGEQVVAIGNALGYGQSVTTGIVSALQRSVSLKNSNGDVITNKFIQTDAAINPGNSGGALLNMKGELVGINSAKVASSSVEGMGYAIPISDVYDLVEELMNRETKFSLDEKDQGYLCISGGTVNSNYIAMHVPAGVLISEAYEGFAAANAGIQKGDIICEIDGVAISSMEEMKKELSYIPGGAEIKVTYARYNESSGSYKNHKVKVKLSSYEDFKKLSSKESNTQKNDENPYLDEFFKEFGY